MPLILCLETATRICSVSLSRDEELLEIKESETPNAHSSKLTVFIDEVMKKSGHALAELDAIAVSMGPGSYTGLRIGVAAAKGLCYALDKPLISIPTLQAMAYGMRDEGRGTKDEGRETRDEGRRTRDDKISSDKQGSFVFRLSSFVPRPSSFVFCPMIDARRMEVYCGLFDQENREIREVRAEIIDEKSFDEFLEKHQVIFAGDGADKCKPVLGENPHAVFVENFNASANYMIPLAVQKFNHQAFENLAYFEPFYLKDFVAGKARVKGLG
jgi:tRNA threonylcarbamoyladenosine biosynthesis protein TsaB